jgi:putative hydrolase of the HAD superfamily
MLLERLGIPAEECVFIDNRRDNIAAAKALGFQVIHAVSTGQVINDLEKLIDL